MATNTALTIGDAARASGLSAHTLRYYERAGLMPPVDRESGGRRRYGEDDLAWIHVLNCLRATGMPIRRMREFAELVQAGDGTEGERLTLLEEHRDAVLADMEQLRTHLDFIEHK